MSPCDLTVVRLQLLVEVALAGSHTTGACWIVFKFGLQVKIIIGASAKRTAPH